MYVCKTASLNFKIYVLWFIIGSLKPDFITSFVKYLGIGLLFLNVFVSYNINKIHV